MSVEIDARLFHRRAGALVASFQENPSLFGDADAVAVVVGGTDDENPYQKGPALQMWLLGYEFTDTVFLITRDGTFTILTSAKKATYLEPILSGSVPVNILRRTKEDSQLPQFFDVAKASGEGKSLGIFPRDRLSGKFAPEWQAAVEASGMQTVDASIGAAFAMGTKDQIELRQMSTASKIAAAIMKNFFYLDVMETIDEEKVVTHEALSLRMDDLLTDKINQHAKRLKFPADADLPSVDWCYLPVVQSGGEYDLRPSAQSNTKTLHAGTILCTLGVRYRSYCSNIARTMLINPTKAQDKNYEFLLELYGFVLSILRPGAKCKEIYNKAVGYVKNKRPDLEANFTKNLGFGIGLEFREVQYILNAKNDTEIPLNAVFNLSVSFQNLENPSAPDAAGKLYALHLADTVVVGAEKTTILTSDCTRDASEVCLIFDEEPAPAPAKAAVKKEVKPELPRSRQASAVLKNKTRGGETSEAGESRRREHQAELARAKQEDGLRRFASANGPARESDKPVFRKFESYKKDTNIPREAGLRIMVDPRSETFLLPVYGLTVPFHISTLKNVTKNDEGEYVYLRFNLISPGQAIGRKEETPFENPNATFIKTLSYRSTDTARLTEVYRQINEMKKQATKAEAERKDKADIVEQDRLIEVSKFKPVALFDVYARPTQDAKRLPGDLEIHSNGLRYRSRVKAENRIDILFNNVQHFFFQPCDNELIVILHVHLKNSIMIGKKKTRDVQFYREATDVSFDETGNRRRRQTYGDEDELQQEQEEKRRRIKLNKEFKEFASKVVDAAGRKFQLDIPYRDLAFSGVPHRANVLLQPTENCLVHLTDPPFTIITISEIEVVHLERVQFGLKNFDMVFVFSDYTRTPVHINSIPISELDLVRDWLDTNDILFSEGPVNLNWTTIMKTINEDPAAFFNDGGWTFLGGGQDQDHSASEESASEFEGESDGFDGASSTDYSSEASAFDEEDSESGSEEDYSSGEDWDELEEKARRADDKKRGREDERPAPPSKKQRR
ncbi:FACT complex subunit spt16 [Blastocladiella emersonii ATCC 22665]|nr:FACT complex subunit spt16 [Blastocladiella emersonii ATCC 22665]